MAGRSRVSDEQIAEALRTHRGVLSHAATTLGMTTRQLRRRIDRSPMLRQAMHEHRLRLAELALAKLEEHLSRGEQWAIRYVLRQFGHYVNLGLPPISLGPHEDPEDVLERLDAIEHQLADHPLPLRDALTLIELRAQVVGLHHKAGDLQHVLEPIVTEVSRAIESVVRDPSLRAQIARELEAGIARAVGRAPRS